MVLQQLFNIYIYNKKQNPKHFYLSSVTKNFCDGEGSVLISSPTKDFQLSHQISWPQYIFHPQADENPTQLEFY